MAKMAKLVNPTWADDAHEALYNSKDLGDMIQITVKALKANLTSEQYIEAGRGLLEDVQKQKRKKISDPKERTAAFRARCLRVIWEYDNGG